ncbi:MAG: hypothetical protein VB939_10545, partial [Pseudomonadales bacterium]
DLYVGAVLILQRCWFRNRSHSEKTKSDEQIPNTGKVDHHPAKKGGWGSLIEAVEMAPTGVSRRRRENPNIDVERAEYAGSSLVQMW